jgi:uncharacterized protein (TIGR02145 family)
MGSLLQAKKFPPSKYIKFFLKKSKNIVPGHFFRTTCQKTKISVKKPPCLTPFYRKQSQPKEPLMKNIKKITLALASIAGVLAASLLACDSSEKSASGEIPFFCDEIPGGAEKCYRPGSNIYKTAVDTVVFSVDGTIYVCCDSKGDFVELGRFGLGEIDISETHVTVKENGAPPFVYDMAKGRWEKFQFTDARDGQTYDAVKIGWQIWMAQDLNFAADSSWPQEHGRQYTLDAAAQSCPEGWHLPHSNEWNILFDYVGKKDWISRNGDGRPWFEGKAVPQKLLLKSGTDKFNFSALLGGEMQEGRWWTSDDLHMHMSNDPDGFMEVYGGAGSASVRCVRDF